ncbi:MAG TPA: YCF48-related protein, partial [Vicinamibacterales bacterium]|nr:YCF48-related protein [Vicinamibacterales bacterium]
AAANAVNAPAIQSETLKKTAPVAGARAHERDRQTPATFSSPDGTTWRIAAADRLERSHDGGATWTPLALPAPVVAGTSPQPAIVWLAGARGIVLLSTDDGRTWQRRPVSLAVDLKSVTAADGRVATVTAVDGRTFTTHDGGITWATGGVQENPAAPF